MKKFIIFCLPLIILLSGCNWQSNTSYTKSGFYFDTVVTISFYNHTNGSLIDKCFKMCENFEKKFSTTIKTSEISKINSSKGAPVKVSDETVELLKKAIYYSELSDGCFDITVGSLSTLWNFDGKENQLPSDLAIQEAISHVNYNNIQIKNNFVTLSDPNTILDLGGIAKGYAADRIREYLKENKVEQAIINLGGNVLTIGSHEIGIGKPFSKTGETISSVSADNCSVVTSGSYERYFIKDDLTYHHILDPHTGFPCDNDLYSVTILSPNSIDGDALSTACFVMGYEKSLELLETLDDIDAIFITKDYLVIDTRNKL